MLVFAGGAAGGAVDYAQNALLRVLNSLEFGFDEDLELFGGLCVIRSEVG